MVSGSGSSGSSYVDDSAQKVGEKGGITLHYPMLTKTNYAVWAIKMRVNLQAQGVWNAIQTGNVESRLDRMALAAIFQAIPEDVVLMLAEKDTAKEAWETLRTMHMGAERVKEAKVQTLRTEFEVMRMKDGETVDEFAMKLNTVVTGILSLGDKIEEITVVKKFLRAVPMKFMQIVTSIEQFGDLGTMSLEEVVGRLKTHEERLRGFDDQTGEPSLLLTHADWSKGCDHKEPTSSSRGRGTYRGRGRGQGRGWGRGEDRDIAWKQKDQRITPKDKSKIQCFCCDKFGHYASECPTKKYDEEANLTQAEDDEPTLL